jgi:hypothetical protein
MKRQSQRDQLLAVITENVRYLVRLGSLSAFRRLEEIEEATGFCTNRARQTHEQLGKAVLAFASIADRHDLTQTAHCAVFCRHYRKGNDDSWHRADKLADDALRMCGIDVDKRNAKMEAA